MLNALIFLDDNYHSISTFPNVSSIKQLKQQFYYIWNKLENGIFYSCNLRSTYIKHCILNIPIYEPCLTLRLSCFTYTSSSLLYPSFIIEFLTWTSMRHTSLRNEMLSPPHRGMNPVFLLMRIQIANKISKPCFTDEMCLCAVWMNTVVTGCI